MTNEEIRLECIKIAQGYSYGSKNELIKIANELYGFVYKDSICMIKEDKPFDSFFPNENI